MTRCPRCGRPYHHEITILREAGVEIAFAHVGAEGEVDMCHSNDHDLPRPYVYDEATHTIFSASEVHE
jgi:hypothetical protein